MAGSSIVIVDRDGNESTQPTANYRAHDAGASNTISDSRQGALRFARSHQPHGSLEAVWAIWPTGTGRWAIRESVRRTDARTQASERAIHEGWSAANYTTAYGGPPREAQARERAADLSGTDDSLTGVFHDGFLTGWDRYTHGLSPDGTPADQPT